jgi:hypothetical protein
MWKRIGIILAACLFVFALADEGQEPPEDKVEKENVKASKIAEEFDVSVDSVNTLRAAFKIGNGGIYKALALSQKSGKSAEEILLMKTDEKMGWGQIAKKLELNPGKDYKSDKRIEEKMQKQLANMEKKAAKKMERAEKRQARGKDK